MKRYVCLTLLTEARVNFEQYGGHIEVFVPLMAVVCKCQTDTNSTGGNGYEQPTSRSSKVWRSDPLLCRICWVVYVHVGVGMEIYSCYYKCENWQPSDMVTLNLEMSHYVTERVVSCWICCVCLCVCVCVCAWVRACKKVGRFEWIKISFLWHIFLYSVVKSFYTIPFPPLSCSFNMAVAGLSVTLWFQPVSNLVNQVFSYSCEAQKLNIQIFSHGIIL